MTSDTQRQPTLARPRRMLGACNVLLATGLVVVAANLQGHLFARPLSAEVFEARLPLLTAASR
jgi:hypothetical protein